MPKLARFGVPEIALKKVVVDILRRELDPDSIKAYGLEFQHNHSPGSILRKCLIDLQAYPLTRTHFTGNQV
jgi:hypothetical protein